MAGGLHVVFGAGPLGLAVLRALEARKLRTRLVTRGGTRAIGSATPSEWVEAEVHRDGEAIAVAGDPVNAQRKQEGDTSKRDGHGVNVEAEHVTDDTVNRLTITERRVVSGLQVAPHCVE